MLFWKKFCKFWKKNDYSFGEIIPFNIRYDGTEFGFDRATDEVPWEQLPEQIKKHYAGLPHERTALLNETGAVLIFSPAPHQYQADGWTKTTSGDWVLS
jgi:hypothetical protein